MKGLIMQLKDKTAIITGGGSGFGASMADLFAKNGAKVIVADLNLDNANKVATQMGGFPVQVDVGNSASVEQMKVAVFKEYQKVDILVNNAGISDGGKALDDVTESDWDRVMDLNIKSIYFLIQAFLPYFRVNCSPEAPKKVINIASIDGCGKINPDYNFSYGASKAGFCLLYTSPSPRD